MQVLAIKHTDMARLLNDIFAQANGVVLKVYGSSMLPTIENGARVMARPLGDRKPKKGDVVIVRALQGNLIAHRIVAYKPNENGARIMLKGDAQPWALETSLDSVIGIITDIVIQGPNGDRLAQISPRNRLVGVLRRVKLGIISMCSWLLPTCFQRFNI